MASRATPASGLRRIAAKRKQRRGLLQKAATALQQALRRGERGLVIAHEIDSLLDMKQAVCRFQKTTAPNDWPWRRWGSRKPRLAKKS